MSIARERTLELSITDGSAGYEIPARIHIMDHLGRDHVPDNAVIVPIAQGRWFACSGQTNMEIPVDTASIRIERGTEFGRLC